MEHKSITVAIMIIFIIAATVFLRIRKNKKDKN